MRRNWLPLAVLVIGCGLFLQIGCQQQAAMAEKPKTAPAAPKPPISTEKAQITEPDVDVSAPEIKIQNPVYDFGEIGTATSNTGEFKFTNAGTGVLKIKKIQSTCGCTVPQLTKKEYAPGESGTVKVTYKSGKGTGPTAKHLYIHSNDKNNPKAKLTVKAKIVLKVAHEPKKLNLMLNNENAGCPDIKLTGLDNQPFIIQGFESTANVITADYDTSVKATEFVLDPEVDVKKLGENRKGTIRISITHPECRLITIPFSVLSKFKVNPQSIIVFNTEPQRPVKRSVWVLNNYGEEFEVDSTSSKKNIVKVVSQEKLGSRFKFELEIMPPAAKARSRVFSDTFFVNIKGGEKLKVSCRGFYKRNKKQ